MNSNRCATGLLVLASILLFVLVSWPLPRFLTSGIPASAHNIEQPAWRYSIHGDHLQYLYRFDLMRDMLTGRIAWFHNPYEFNTGNDADRYRPSAYFLPLSGIYALLKPVVGQAMAWNLLLCLSIVLSALFTWGWLRRFTQDTSALAIGVALSLLVPFRWSTLFGGSPSGHVLMWLPLLAWGIDVAVREASWLSGGWVGATLLMCFWGDLQVFYFAVLATPVFALISLIGHEQMQCPWRRWYRVLPLGLLSSILMGGYYVWKRHALSGAAMGGGRDWHEVSIYSPSLRGLWEPLSGINGTFFLGIFILLAMTLVVIHLIASQLLSPQKWSLRHLCFALVLCAFAGTILLALGTNGPREGWFMRVARAIIPGYGKIRQPTKIFALMPMWLAWLMAIGWTGVIGEHRRWRLARHLVIVALLVGATTEICRNIDVTVCRLENEQPAYAAVAEDAKERSIDPGRALVIPIWPGDAADTSLPVHWAQHYGLRLLNGYSAATPQDYVDNQFRRFQSANQGLLTNAQIHDLLAMGIHYVIVHENMFPEKVSPFPIQATLSRLQANPQLTSLHQSGAVHTFRLHPSPQDKPAPPPLPSCLTPFPSRRWFCYRETSTNGIIVDASDAVLGKALQLDAASAGHLELDPTRVATRDGLQWWIRTRGKGRLRVATRWGGILLPPTLKEVVFPDWSWIQVPVASNSDYAQAMLEIDAIEGQVDLDTVLLAGTNWPTAWPRDTSLTIPATCFFHAGYRDADGQSVVLRTTHEPADTIFYGPGLPLPAGRYRIEPIISTDIADTGKEVGKFRARTRGDDPSKWTPIVAGQPTSMDWDCPNNRPFVFELKYNRRATIQIHHITITCLIKPGPSAE
jgi:hypothetical protein